MPKPKHHVLICTNSRPQGHPKGSCAENGADEVLEKFQMEREMNNLWELMMVTRTGCMGPCDMGPTVVVYPEGTWYVKVKVEDVNEIIENHLMNGKPVERLKIPKHVWGE
jgi:(2Fe-2S) ferredoxin